MTFKGDIHRTRVKNSSFGDPNFSVPARAISLIYFCLKVYVKMQSMMRLFFLNLTFYVKKSDKLKVSKNSLKVGFYSYKYLYNNKNKA